MNLKHGLTARDLKLLNLIHSSVERRGTPPSIRELCTEFNDISTNTAVYWLNQLQNAGMLTRQRKQARSMRLTSVGLDAIGESKPQQNDANAVNLLVIDRAANTVSLFRGVLQSVKPLSDLKHLDAIARLEGLTVVEVVPKEVKA